MPDWTIHLLETPAELAAVETLQSVVWPGPDIEIVPKDIMLAAVHNGGLAIGALVEQTLVGAVFGFPGFYPTPDGPRLKHCSHLLAVLPDWRNKGVGFALKRAQWQMVRKQGIDRITWTYEPLLSRNAHLNIARLGAVCNTYLREAYGDMHDELNTGLPSDRFQVDWWLNTHRVERHLSRRARPPGCLTDCQAAGAALIVARPGPRFRLRPPESVPKLEGSLLLIEIPSDLSVLKESDLSLAHDWRFYTRQVFETAFSEGYLVTDFIRDGERSFYVLAHGDSTL